MSVLQWSPRLQLDLPEIDRAHRGLIDLMARLAEESDGRAPKAQQLATFRALSQATHAHFADEERLMQRIGYVDTEKHKAIHARLLEQVDGHLAAFEKSPTSQVPAQVFDFLKVWLQAHIAGIDRKYADVAHAQKVGAR